AAALLSTGAPGGADAWNQCSRNSPSTARNSAGLIRRACATVTEWSRSSSSRVQKSRNFYCHVPWSDYGAHFAGDSLLPCPAVHLPFHEGGPRCIDAQRLVSRLSSRSSRSLSLGLL